MESFIDNVRPELSKTEKSETVMMRIGRIMIHLIGSVDTSRYWSELLDWHISTCKYVYPPFSTQISSMHLV